MSGDTGLGCYWPGDENSYFLLVGGDMETEEFRRPSKRKIKRDTSSFDRINMFLEMLKAPEIHHFHY